MCFAWWVIPGLAAAECNLPVSSLNKLQAVVIDEVYDGDTVLLKDQRKVRFIGINTPETAKPDRPGEPLADQATAFLKGWEGKQVFLKVGIEGKDRYGRVLGHLFSPAGENLTALLLRKGLGFTVTIPPNTGFADCYVAQAQAAQAAYLGVWDHPYFRLRTTSMSEDLKPGFGRYKGKIESVYVAKKVIWIDLFGHVTLRVSRKDLPFVKGDVLEAILDAVDNNRVLKLPHIEFSGWLMDRTQWGSKMAKKVASGKRKRWQMNIRHRHHWRWSKHLL